MTYYPVSVGIPNEPIRISWNVMRILKVALGEQLLLSAFVILLIRQQAQIYGLGLRRTWCSTWRHVVLKLWVFQWWQQNFEHPIGFCWALHWSCWWRLGISWVTVVFWGAPGPLIVIIQGQARLEMFGQSQQLTKNPHPAGFGWTWGKKCRGLLHPLEEHRTC